MTCHAPANPTPTARVCQPHAPGFSLVELSVAVAISGIIFMALGSAMVLASRALPDKTDAALASHDVGRVLEQLSTDLQHALYVSERSAHAITFTVADRTGDGSPQRMRYAWTGEPGEPLTWQLDDHEPVELLPSLADFTLGYEQQGYMQTHAGPVEQGVQTLVASQGIPSSEYRSAFGVDNGDWIGQIIWPDISALDSDDVLYWRPTYASYRASKPSLLLPPSHWVQLRVPELDHRPSDIVLAHHNQSGGLLGSGYGWRDATFNDPPWLKPGQPVNLVVGSSSWSTAARVEYHNNTSRGGMLRTTNGQSAWGSASSNHAMTHTLYAVPYTVGPSQSLTRHHLTRVQISMQANGNNHPQFHTAVHLPNRPGVLASYWEANFRHDPTSLDANADGVTDFAVIGSSDFTTSNLNSAAGSWRARQSLRTWPDHDFTEPVVIHLRLRQPAADGGAALMRLYADRRNGYVGPVGVYVQRDSNGRQRLDLITRDAYGQTVTLTSVPDLSSSFIDVRLAVLPTRRSVHLTVNGVDHGTYVYEYVSANGEPSAIELTGWQTDAAEFEHLRVTVGGDS